MNTPNPRQRIRFLRALVTSTAVAAALLATLFLTLRPSVVIASGPAPIGPWGTGSERTTSLTVGDMDNDGDLDLVVGNEGEANRIYLNNGRGVFPTTITGTITLSNSAPTSVMAAADLNGDGWLDLVALSAQAPAQLYLNGQRDAPTATVRFAATQALSVSAPLTPVLTVGDLDDDADFDLVIGGADAMTRVYLNDGQANFSPAAGWLTAAEAMSATAMTLADVNRDNRLDLVLGFDGRPAQVFLNRDGAGFDQGATIGEASGRVAALVAGNLNGDEVPDLAIAYSNGTNLEQPIRVYTIDTTTLPGKPVVQFKPSSSLSVPNNDTPMTLALGDVNNDGALDLAVGFGERSGSAATRNRVLFNNGQAVFKPDDVQYFGSGAERTYAVALADLDHNGSLDFIAANRQERHRIYFAHPGAPQLVFAQAQVGPAREYLSIALGDLDGNGTLDAVAGARNAQLSYLGETRFEFGVTATTMSLALADLDNDNDLDVIAGYASGQPNYVYYNDGQGNFTATVPLTIGNALSDTWGVAVGYLNQDTWPDIVASSKKQSAIYLNDGQGGFPVTPTQALGGPDDPTTSVAVGDLNGDGRPDIVVGNDNAPNAVYFNDGAGHFAREPDWRFGNEFESTKALALGDIDRDGDLDLVVANFFAPNVVYFNDGDGRFSTEHATYLGTLDNKTYSVVLADFDGDGVLDIVAGTWATSSDIGLLALDNVIYLNDGRGGFADARTVILTRGKHYTRAVAVGDLNGDLKPDIVFADRYNPNDGIGRLMFLTNRRRGNTPNAQTIRLETTALITSAQALSAAHWLTYTLVASNQGGCNFNGVLEFSFDGGITWLPIVSPTATRVLTWSLSPDQSKQWHDDLDLRMLLTSTVRPCPNRPAGPYQFNYVGQGNVSIPILTPLQVLSGTAPIAGALVYRQAAGERLAAPLSGPGENADLNHNDRLFALWPVTETHQWLNLSPLNPATPVAAPSPVTQADQGSVMQTTQTDAVALASQTQQIAAFVPATRTKILSVTRASLFYTSAPIEKISDSSSQNAMPRVTTGVFTVTVPGTQTLIISPSNPLLLFDLKVALEWDAHNDRGYVARLTSDLQRASELLYDWSNGQAALGQIALAHDAALQPTANGSNAWLDADVRIHATNRLRPSATQGGIVSTIISDPVKLDIAYGPGAVEIGAVWNRFGDATAGNLSEDLPRALAHELGHLLFFLDDNYLGLDDQDGLKPVTGCTGVMADPYQEDDTRGNGEFHLPGDWDDKCGQTLSQKNAGRSDWTTIQAFYPWLQAPITNTAGPDILPLRVTQIVTETWPASPQATLANPDFYLLDVDAVPVQPGAAARAFLYKKGGQRIVDLGRPQLDRVTARGAQAGDTLCVTDPDANRQGCTTVQERGNPVITLVEQAGDWDPDVMVSPQVSVTSANSTSVTTTLMALTLTGVPTTGSYLAAIVPSDAPLTKIERISMEPQGNDFKASLPFTGSVGFIDITMNGNRLCLKGQNAQTGAEPCRITLDLTVNGSPAKIVGTGRLAPVLSNDGQAMLYGQDLTLDETHLAVLQTAVKIPDLPSWAALVGHAHRLATTANVTLTKTSLSIGFLGSEVPPGEEASLRIHHWNEQKKWQPLPTTRDLASNNTVAAIHESGLYALLSSTEIALRGAGWHAFGYPVSEPLTRTITDALASLPTRTFTLVYGYTPTLATDPWQVYAPDAPAGFNTLQELRFGQGYFIHTTGDAVLRFKGLSPFAESASGIPTDKFDRTSPSRLLPTPTPRSLISPPMLIYGRIEPGADFTPTAGLTVTAWINGQACGHGLTAASTGGAGVAYSVMVHAADEDPWSGCGVPGTAITFSLPSLAPAPSAPAPVIWNNSAAQVVTLTMATVPTPPITCANLLRDGGFEQNVSWRTVTTDSTARYTNVKAHSGSSAMQLGLLTTDPLGPYPATETLSTAYQDVRLPANAQKLTLTLWVEPGTQDSSGDYQRLLLLNPSNSGVISEQWRGLENQDGWQQLSFDLTAYRGRSVRVYLEVRNDNQRLGDRTWMFVDDICLESD